ncbi:unnamed protein product [Cochlearia groenlandica]
MWMVFGGKPLKFSSREFALTTSLPCGQFPDATTINWFKNNESDNPSYWDELLGENRELNIENLVNMLQSAVSELQKTEQEVGVDKEVKENSKQDGGNEKEQKAIDQKERGKRKRLRSEKLQDSFTPGSRLRPLFAAPKKVVPYHPLTQPNIEDFETFKKALEKEGEKDVGKGNYPWDNKMTPYVLGKRSGRGKKSMWVKDVDTIYVPMKWPGPPWLPDNADAVKTKRKGKVANEDGEASKVIDDDNAK